MPAELPGYGPEPHFQRTGASALGEVVEAVRLLVDAGQRRALRSGTRLTGYPGSARSKAKRLAQLLGAEAGVADLQGDAETEGGPGRLAFGCGGHWVILPDFDCEWGVE